MPIYNNIMNEQQRSLQQLLASFHEDQLQTAKHLLAQLERPSTDTNRLLTHLNTLLNAKALPQRQRRDVAGIARLVADSKIFPVLTQAIEKEITNEGGWIVYQEAIKLITQICWENPHLIQDLMANAPQTINHLLDLLSEDKTISTHDDSLTQGINFLHSISLKQGQVRSEKMPKVLCSFLSSVFTNDKFCEGLQSKKLNLLYSSLTKFNSNVPETDASIFTGLLKALHKIGHQYTHIGEEWSTTQDPLSFRDRCHLLDKRLVALLKLQEKARCSIFQKIDPLCFLPLLKLLTKIAIHQPLVLVDSPYDNKMLVNTMQEVVTEIEDWSNDLQTKFKEKQEGKEEMISQEEGLEVSEEDINAVRVDFDRVNSDYYFSRLEDIRQYRRVKNMLTTVRPSLLATLHSTLSRIQTTHFQLQTFKSLTSSMVTIMKEQYDFILQLQGSKLDRILNLMMKVTSQDHLIKSECYKGLLPKLPIMLDIFYSRGIRTHIETLHSLIPQLNNMTSESNTCHNRYIFQRLDEDSLKTHLHLKITSIQNCKNLISDTIIRFGYYLSDYPDYLQAVLEHFLKPMLEIYKERYLSEISGREKLLMDDVEVMRMMVKVVVELFPVHKNDKEELVRTKVYYYCMLVRDKKVPDILQFLNRIVQIISRHDIASTQELRDTHANRKEVVTTIFTKLIIHKLRTFYGTIASYHDDLSKLATPTTINTPIGSHQLPREFMFQGPTAYLHTMVNCLKGLVIRERDVLAGEAVGMLVNKGLEFRSNEGFQNAEDTNSQQLVEYRETETDKYNCLLEEKCVELYDWLMDNLSKPLVKLPMLIKKILHYQRQRDLFQLQSSLNTQKQIKHVDDCFRKISEVVDTSHFLLEGSHLNLGIRMNKKRKVTVDQQKEVDIKGEVNKLANCCIIVAQYMLESNANQFTKRGLCRISQNYISSLIDFSLLFLNKFQAEVYFPTEANYLIQGTLWLIECYLAYKEQLQEMKDIKKKDRKIRKKIEKKMEGRGDKRKSKRGEIKQQKKDNIKKRKIIQKGMTQPPEKSKGAKHKNIIENAEDEERPPSRKDKRRKKKRGSLNQRGESKVLQRHKSKANLQNKKDTKPVEKQQHKESKKQQKKPYINQKIQQYIRLILLASNKAKSPFLKSLTLQYLLRFLSINAKKNCLSKPPSKYFEISLVSYLPELLKLKIQDRRMLGYHQILCRLGLKQLTEENMRINYETGIKRYMFDRGDKEVLLGDFLSFLEISFRKPPSLPHLLQIVYRQQDKPDKLIPFTIDILNGIVGTSKVKNCIVRLKKSVQLNMMTNGEPQSKKKTSHVVEEEKQKPIKMSDYVPEGDINPFVTQIITHIIGRLVTEISRSMEHLQHKQQSPEQLKEPILPLEPFNLKVLITTLHYILRESPSLVPWVAKFKCKKIIINAIKNQTRPTRELVTRYVFGLLNKYGEKSQTINEIGFLQVLIRLASPFVLNTISCLIFELCLDSTPLVQSNKEGQGYISFGSVVRQRVVSELEFIIFGGEPPEHLFRKVACLNLMTVLLNNREMSRLLIQSSFIPKLYSEYSAIMTRYSEKKQRITIPGVYLTKIYIPFLLEPLSLLQELNIAFHHNKKLNKNQKGLEYSLIVLSEDAINSQLVPTDILKRNKFKSDWPYGKRQRRQHDHNEFQGSDDDSLLGLSHSDDSLTEQIMDEDDSIAPSDLQEERRADLQMIEEEYVSMESNNQSQLLNDEWDYSNSQDSDSEGEIGIYPEEDDRIIQREIQRELAANRARQLIDGSEQEDQDDLEEMDEEDGPVYDDDGNEIDLEQLQDPSEGSIDQGDSNYYQVRSSISDYFSNDSADSQSFYTASQQLKSRFRQEQAFYENVTDVITFQKLNVVPKISKAQIVQVYNLRLFLQLYNHPQRVIEEQTEKNIKSTSENAEEKQIQELMPLLDAFADDRDMKLGHFVEWNQVYRYDHFLKVMPMGEQYLAKLFTDQQGSTVPRRRRHGVLHREHIELPGWGPNLQMIPNPAMAIRVVRGEHLQAEPSEHHDDSGDADLRQVQAMFRRGNDGYAENEGMQIEYSSISSSSSDSQGEQGQEVPQQLELRVNNILHTDADIDQILRQLNMNMTLEEFHAMPAELQTDIIQNYYMADQHRDVPPNSPQVPPVEQAQVNDLARGRVREDPLDMSPRFGGQPIPNEQMVPEQPQGQQQHQPAANQIEDEYKKISQEHLIRIGRDLLESLNKEGKNNLKFYEAKQQQLSQLFVQLFGLSSKEHRLFPYNLFQTCCINTVNLSRIVSSLMAVLMTALQQSKESSGEKMGEEKKDIDSELILKIVHLMYHLTSNYSVAMQFLTINSQVIPPYSQEITKEQQTVTSLELLIKVLNQIYKLKHPQALKFLIDLLENITTHHFYKSINSLIVESEHQQIANINEIIEISQETAFQLGGLLKSQMGEDNTHAISRIIMRLSLNQKNIGYFILFMKRLVAELTQFCLDELNEIVRLSADEEPMNKGYMKIVNLMNIFFQMVVSFNTYPTNKDKHHLILTEFRNIVSIDSLQLLCETATKHLFSSTKPTVQNIMGEVLECFFILYEIGLATSSNPKLTSQDDNQHKHIAELGQIQEMRILTKSNELLREEEIILGNFNLSKLWRQSISQPAFKSFINNCIRKKLQKSELGWASMGIFDVPIFKVAISTPHMLSFDNKHLIFKAELKRLRKKAKYHMMHLHLSREEVFEDSFTQIMQYTPEILKGKLKIEFREEEGQDAGGLTRQWFQLLSRKMFDANYALFTPGSNGNTYHPSPQSYVNRQHLQYFKFIGRITGKALYDGYLLDAYFTPAFYKHILNLPITYLDMEEEDYEYFNSLKWIMENSPIQDYLELNFTHSFDNFGQITTKQLLPGGQDKLVTEENKYEYVQLSSYAKMATSIKKQLEAFLEGFHDLIPHRLIRIFNEKELEILISGRPTIDIEDLKRNTDFVNYLKHDQIIVWFFEVLEEFDMELRTAFLQFVTGSSRVPVEGFKQLRGMNGAQKFNIHREFQEDRLPRAHTCFNQLDLPNYKSKQILVEKLMLAITEGKEGFHLL